MMREGALLILGLTWGFNTTFKVKVNFGTLCIKPYRHGTDFTALTNCE